LVSKYRPLFISKEELTFIDTDLSPPPPPTAAAAAALARAETESILEGTEAETIVDEDDDREEEDPLIRSFMRLRDCDRIFNPLPP
jgi:hypothetical protein